MNDVKDNIKNLNALELSKLRLYNIIGSLDVNLKNVLNKYQALVSENNILKNEITRLNSIVTNQNEELDYIKSKANITAIEVENYLKEIQEIKNVCIVNKSNL
jgi:hypothetical protein